MGVCVSTVLLDKQQRGCTYFVYEPPAGSLLACYTLPPREGNVFYSGGFVIVTASTLHTHTQTHFHPISFRGSVSAADAFAVSYSGLLGKLLCVHTDRHFTVDMSERGGGHSDLDYLSGVTEGGTQPSPCPQTVCL